MSSLPASASIPSRVLTLSGAVFEQTDLPPLEAVALTGTESINAIFEYRLVVQTPEREPGFEPWVVDPALLLDRTLTVNLELEGWGTFVAGSVGDAGLAGQGAGQRQISGVICEVHQADSDSRHQRVELVIRPGLFEATLAVHSHPFQDKSVVEVLDDVLANYPWPVDKRLSANYPTVDLTTQYQETDWHFMCRLMQNAGINFHFEHADGTHRLVLSDHNSAFLPIGAEDSPYREIPIHPPGHRIDREYIHAFSPVHRITSTAWESRDHDYTRPRLVRVARAGEVGDAANETPESNTHARREVSTWRGHQSGAGGLWSQPNAGRDPNANASPGQIQVQLKSDHQHSSLSMGYVTRIEDNAGRKDARGDGAELRTDGHAVVRAALGVIVTTTERLAAQGGMKEINEAALGLAQALDRHDQLAAAAVKHNAQDASDQQEVAQAMKGQDQEIKGNGQALGEMTQPHVLFDSAAGIQTTAATSTQQASGEHHAIVAGGHASVVAGKSFLASATQAVRLFARKAGMRLFAAEKNIEIQAQAGSVEITAKDTIRLRARDIDLQATELVLINGDGSHTRLVRSGITHATAGGWNVHSNGKEHTGPKSLPVEPPNLPTSQPSAGGTHGGSGGFSV